jgi:hypothetical protein
MPLDSLADVGDGPLQGIGDGRFRHPIAATEPHGRQFPRVHQPVHRHLRDTHDLSDLGHREEADVGQFSHEIPPPALVLSTL